MIEIIPAMDLIDGSCVRLLQGDFSRETVYSTDPLEIAKRFEDAGMKRLHMVDLDGARSGKPANLQVLDRIASATSLVIDYGGGIRTDTDAAAVFEAGASVINVGSIAVRDPELLFDWITKFGAHRFLLGADSKNGNVAIDAWKTETDEPIVGFLSGFATRGVTRIFVTDIANDGTLAGPSLELYREILATIPSIDLIASGGVTSTADVDALEAIGCKGVIIGKAIYERSIALEELSRYVG